MRLGIDGRRLVQARTGVGRYLERLIWHWNRMPIAFDEVVCYVPRDVAGPESAGRSVRIQTLASTLPGVLWENGPLRQAARQCGLFFGASYSLPFLCPAPAVVSNLGIYDSQPGSFPIRQRWRNSVYRASARAARLVIANSLSTKRDLAHFYDLPAERIRVIYPGVDEVFGPVDDAAELRTRVSTILGHDAPYFLMVGKLSTRRHIPELLAAFAQLRAAGRTERLVIVGANHVGLPLEQLIRDAGVAEHVSYRPHAPQEDLRFLYAGATAFVLPTTHEGFSFTILEALACGAPVITVDHPPLREGVHQAVIALDAPSPALLSDAMLRVASSPELAADLRARGLECAGRFSWRRAAEQTMDVLAEAAGL